MVRQGARCGHPAAPLWQAEGASPLPARCDPRRVGQGAIASGNHGRQFDAAGAANVARRAAGAPRRSMKVRARSSSGNSVAWPQRAPQRSERGSEGC
mmetsp:Transcript_52449/g.162438  ORF Transcript_52449/g.162438 Transcript_52449/m.162438 type:complete len:97 (+) Transcript_52449:1080-1370(+)